MKEALLDRFLRYVQVGTQSDESSSSSPSTPGQLQLLEMLRAELVQLGAADVTLTRHGYVLATIPATASRRGIPTVAFFAHVDTAPDFSGTGVKPIVHRNYDGKPIRFPRNSKLVLDDTVAPELFHAKGKDIVTASGDTLLGADDKAGVACLMTLADQLLNNSKVKHGKVRLCFTPDEEIGRGVDHLSLKELGTDVGYTLDGHSPGEICWETFPATALQSLSREYPPTPATQKAKV
jgi:tripeptide aminopeptidase